MRVALALALLLLPSLARAGDPALVWRTIETPHFVINYHGETSRLAQRLAIVAEAAHDKLVPFLDHEVKHKTWVLLTDTTDDANGSATVIPYPTINLFSTAPDDRSELNDYDDWLYALITHEYTHIVHLDTVHGIARVVNAILGFGEWGQLYAPNQAQPRFLIEGLAVFEETERSSAGRLRSTIYDMWLRTATLEGRFQRLDQFSNYPIQWPRAGAAYLYGSAFLRYIASLFGPDVFRQLSHEYGGSWIPGGLNRALRRVTGGKRGGATFETLYDGFRESMAARYRIIPVGGGKPETFYKVDAAGGAALSPDSSTFYFGAVEVHRSQYYLGDLFALDIKRDEKRQLTFGRRAENPDLSPDGRHLAYSVNEASSRSLYVMALDAHGEPAGERRLIGNLDDLSQIFTPAWSPDGKSIVFSWWRQGGFRDIWTIDVQSGETTRITADRALDLDPRYSPDGRFIYFSSDRTGIYNLYAYELSTKKTFQVTNVVGGAFDVAISPDGKHAAFVGFVADGWNLQVIDLDPTSWRVAAPALLERPDADVPQGFAEDHPLPSRPYQPWRTAWPGRLNIQSYPDAFGQVLQLSVGGGDIAGIHDWSATLGLSLARADDVYAGFSYTYNRLFPTIALSGYRFLTRRGGFFIDGINRGYVEDDYSLNAGVGLPLVRRMGSTSDLFFNYNFVYLRNADRDKLPLDPNLISARLPETGRVASLGMGWSWSNARRFTFSVSPETGRSLALNVGVSLPGIGSEYQVFTATWRYVEYLPMPWPGPLRHHVLALSYGGGLSGGQLRRRSNFYLGGYQQQQQDVLRAFFDFSRAGTASLRGYQPAAVGGNEFHLLNAEYRFPIAWIERGLGTFPFYLKRLHGVVFADYGNAWNGGWSSDSLKNFKLGVGGEVRLDLNFFYYFGATLQLGYAHGFMEGGLDQVYFLLNNPF